MSGNARFHDKLHRANHHTLSTGGLLDSAYDPIASPEHPFRGDFILSGGLSALGDIIANKLTIKSDLVTRNHIVDGTLRLANPYFGATAIYAVDPTTQPKPFTLSLNYENGVFVSDDFYVQGNTITNDITANGAIYANFPTVDGVTLNTRDVGRVFTTVKTNSASWNASTTWVNSNSSNMTIDNILITGNLTALGSTTLVNLTTNTTDSLSVVNVGLAVPAIYAEIVTADKPVLSLKQKGVGPILSASSTNSTFIIGNSGWVGIGGAPSTQLDIYALSSTVDGGNLKLRGATGSSKNYVVSVKNSNLNFSHTPTNSETKTVAMAVTPSNQLSINAESIPGWAGTDPKLYVAGGFLLSGSNQTIVENLDYQNIYNYDNLVPERGGAVTRIYNLSGDSAAPLSGFSSNPGYNAPGYYTAWSTRVFPYIGGTLGVGYGALGGGGVARIDLGYEGLQSQAELKGVISFATLCASQITSVPGTVERMRINSVGNIGIGTSLPTYRLHVLGDNDNDINFMTNGTLGVYNKLDANRSYGFLSVSQQYTLLGSNLRLSGETASPVYKKGTNERAGAGILIYNANGTNALPTTKFVYSSDTDNDLYTVSESMVISGQRVGINKSTPGTTLHVGGAITLDSETISVETSNVGSSAPNTYNLSGVYMQFAPGASNNDWAYLRQIGTDNKYHLSLDLHDDHLLNGKTGGGQSFSIRNIGSTLDPDEITTLFHLNIDSGVPYAGIGASTPESNLHISSGINSNGHCYLTLESDTDNNGANEDCHPGIIFKQDGGVKQGYLGYLGADELNIEDNNQFQVRSGHGIVFSTGGANFGVNYGYNETNALYLSANPRMFIHSDGKIGINTLSPQYQLDVNGSMNVSGQLTGTTINDIYTKINGVSSNWQNIFTTVKDNSATTWSYQGADLKALSSNWQNTFTTVKDNSATTWSYQGADLKALTGNWESTYNTVNSNSATTWSYQGADLKALSSNWQNTFTTVKDNSAVWANTGLTTEDVQDTVNNLLSAGKGISIRYDDANNKLELSTTANLSTSTGLTPGYYPLTNSSNRLEDGGLRQAGSFIFLSNNDAAFYTTGTNSHIYTTGTNSHIYTTGLNSQIYTNSGHIYTNSGNISSRTGNLFLSAGNVLAPIGIVSAASANFVNLSSNYVKFKSYSETSVSVSIPGTFIYTVDLSQGTVFPIRLDKNITSFQLQNIPTGVNSFLILLTQDGTGSKTVTWTFTGKILKWSGGAPTVTSTANATDMYSFMSVDGNTWYGSVAGKNFV
jgi:hypothetical protein